jgi:hypothetical protein
MDANGNFPNIFIKSFVSDFKIIYETVYRIHGQDYLGQETIAKVKLSPCLTNYALRHECVWGRDV